MFVDSHPASHLVQCLSRTIVFALTKTFEVSGSFSNSKDTVSTRNEQNQEWEWNAGMNKGKTLLTCRSRREFLCLTPSEALASWHEPPCGAQESMVSCM